jgi:hypothetical protein
MDEPIVSAPWQIRVPYFDRDDPLTSVADAARTLDDPEDRAECRQLLDNARLAVGLASATAIR